MTKWMVSSNYLGGMVYQVFKKIDESKIDHAGNREYYHQIFESEEEAQAMADKLNENLFQLTKQYYGCESDVIFTGTHDECFKELYTIREIHSESSVRYADTPFYDDLMAFKDKSNYIAIHLEKVDGEDSNLISSFYYKEEK